MHFPRFSPVAVLALIPCVLFAQPKTLTLQQAIDISLTRNLNVVQAQNNVEAAQSQVMAARGMWLPTLSANTSWARSQQETYSSGGSQYTLVNGVPVQTSIGEVNQRILANSFRTGLNANWTVFDGLNREASNSAATSQAIATEQTSVRTRQSIVFQVVSSYLNVLRNDQLVKVTEENLRRDQRQLERIVESNRVGALSLADVYRQQSQTANDELSVINAKNTYDKSKADLLALIGMDVYDEYELVDPSIMGETDTLKMRLTAEQYRDFSALTQRALQARPDYIGAAENLSAAESQVTSAKSSYLPSIYLSGGYSRYGNELKLSFRNTNLNWGLGLQWTLFDGFRTNQGVQQAVATKRNAEITLSQAQKNIGVDVRKALLDLEAARKSLEVSQKGLVSAEEDRKIAEERYNLGAGTLLDLLVANANLVSAQANKVNATYGYVTARYNIEYVLGEKSL